VDRTLGRRSGGSEFGRFGGQAEGVEDLLDGVLVADEGQQASRAAAMDADEGVDQEHAFQEVRPEAVRPASRRLPPAWGERDAAEVGPGRGTVVFLGGFGRTLQLGLCFRSGEEVLGLVAAR